MIPFERILCPVDFSERSFRALTAANELALNFSSELILVHVVEPVPIPYVPFHLTPVAPPVLSVEAYEQEMCESSRRTMANIIKEHTSPDIHTRSIVVVGRIANEIVRIAKKEGVDLVVLSTHGRTGLEHMLLGSVAENVVRTATCAVLTIHTRPGGEEKNQED